MGWATEYVKQLDAVDALMREMTGQPPRVPAPVDLAEQARTTALGYVMQAVSVQMEAPTPDADVLAALDVVVDLLSGKG